MRATLIPSMIRSSPAPSRHADCPSRVGESGHCSRMVNKFNLQFRQRGTSCRVTAVNRSDRARFERNSSNFKLLCSAACANLSRLARCLRRSPAVRTGGGPRRPNAARALCEESELTEVCRRRRRARGQTRIPSAAPYFLVRPVRQAAGLASAIARHSALGRSHRGALGKAKLAEAIERTHALLGLPADYRLGIVPASDTGAMEMAIWSLLGPRPVTMLAWESFGAGWVTDVAKQLKLDADIRTADYGADLRPRRDRSGERRRVHLERHDQRRPRSRRRVDRRRPHRPYDLRRDVGRLRAGHRLGEDRCRHLQLAKGARRRGGARHARAQPARGRAARAASRRRGRCPRSSA